MNKYYRQFEYLSLTRNPAVYPTPVQSCSRWDRPWCRGCGLVGHFEHMSLNVIISSLDGKQRVPVIISNSQPLREIIPQALQKLKLTEEINRYGLRHGRQSLELATIARLSGLAPGAKLDLFLVTSQLNNRGLGEIMVNVALQFESFPRITASISGNSPLWTTVVNLTLGAKVDLIGIMRSRSANCHKTMTPHLLIMGQEVFGLKRLVDKRLQDVIGTSMTSALIRMTLKEEKEMSLDAALQLIQGIAAPAKPTVGEHTQLRGTETEISTTQDEGDGSILASRSIAEIQSQTALADAIADRRIRLYPPPEKTSPSAPDLPDEFYQVSEMDLRYQMSSLKQITKSLIDAPLVSHTKLLEKRQRELLSKHPISKIRFRFPDHYLLEANFKSTETGADLHSFLLDHCLLIDHSQGLSLTTGLPPKRIERGEGRQLWQLDLVPASIVNVFIDSALKGSGTMNLLRNDLHQLVLPSPSLSISGETESIRRAVAEPNPSMEDTASNASETARGIPVAKAAGTSSGGRAFKKPSWLRL